MRPELRREAVRIAAGVAFNVEDGDVGLFIEEYDAQMVRLAPEAAPELLPSTDSSQVSSSAPTTEEPAAFKLAELERVADLQNDAARLGDDK